jgi:hypothetical protein
MVPQGDHVRLVPVARGVVGIDLANEEETIAPLPDGDPNKFLRGAISIRFGGVDEREAKIDAFLKRRNLLRTPVGTFRHHRVPWPGGNLSAIGKADRLHMRERVSAASGSNRQALRSGAAPSVSDLRRFRSGRPAVEPFGIGEGVLISF